VNKPEAAVAGDISVTINFDVDAARAGAYSNEVDVDEVQGFADAVERGEPVTTVSAVFDDSAFSAVLPSGIPVGQVVMVVGENAEKTGTLRTVTREVAEEQLATSCGGS
jgi:hypothetical protein